MSIVSKVTTLAGKSLLQGKKYSPEVLVVTGVVGLVTAGVLASRATTRLEDVIGQHEGMVLASKDARASATGDPKKAEKEYKKDMVFTYRKTAFGMIKLYGPSITLGAASVVSILGAYGILKKRNVALLGAYKAVESSFSKYRERVVEEYGADKDQEFKLGLRAVSEKGEDGKTHKVLKQSTNKDDYSIYAKFFDEFNPNWKRRADYNLVFLKAQQQYANDMLIVRGHVFLNEVYDSLGMDHTSAGSHVGWVLNKNGDNFVDFGLMDDKKDGSRRFVNGDEAAIRLDFNVDGVIYDLIGNSDH